LGSLDLRASDGRQILSVLAQPKRVALLAYLAANQDYVRRDTLLGLFWPESDEEHARHALRQSVYTLRRGLGPRALASRGDEELRIDCDHIECDVAAFETAVQDGRAEAALELYKGDLLEGFFLSDAPEFEKWLDGRRTTLRNQAAEAAWAIAQAAEAAANGVEAAEWARRAAEYAPDEESTVQRLVGLLDRVGDRAAALRAYEAFAWRLENELGLQPSPETQALVAEIRARQEAAPHSGDDKASRARAQPVDGEWSLPDESLLEGAPKATAEFELAAAEISGESGATRVTRTTAERTGSAEATGAEAETPGGEPKKHRVLLGIAVAALAMAAVIVDFAEVVQWAASRFYGDGSSSDAVEAPGTLTTADLDPRRIAVLYFDDLSEEQNLAHLADGFTEVLIQRLSQIDGLKVLSRNGVKPYRNADVTLDSIVKVLRPGTIVAGSVMGGEDRIRVNVQLIDAATNTHIDSETLNRPSTQLLALLDDLSSEVVEFLRMRLGEEVRTRQLRAGTASQEAWTRVLRAELTVENAGRLRFAGNSLEAEGLYARADELLAEAEDLDPDWVDPIIARGRVAGGRARLPGAEPSRYDRTWIEAGIGHATRALEMSPDNSAALELRGSLHADIALGDPGEEGATALELAFQDLETAVVLSPEAAGAWAALSMLHGYQGRFEEARMTVERALEADPFLQQALDTYYWHARAALDLMDLPEVLYWADEGLARSPEDKRFAGLRLMAGASGADVDLDDAWESVGIIERSEERTKWPSHWLKMSIVLVRAGLVDSAHNVMNRARSIETEDPFVFYYEAYARLLLGEQAEALDLLGTFINLRPNMKPYLSQDPWFESLREDPDFQSIVAAAD
jgi:serine/threonine-protein kinase